MYRLGQVDASSLRSLPYRTSRNTIHCLLFKIISCLPTHIRHWSLVYYNASKKRSTYCTCTNIQATLSAQCSHLTQRPVLRVNSSHLHIAPQPCQPLLPPPKPTHASQRRSSRRRLRHSRCRRHISRRPRPPSRKTSCPCKSQAGTLSYHSA